MQDEDSYRTELLKFRNAVRPNAVKKNSDLENILAWQISRDEVAFSLCERLIEASAWWYKHPCGRPVRAPNHVAGIYKSRLGYAIDFGWNKFLIGASIARSAYEINIAFNALFQGSKVELDQLRKKIELHVSGCVATASDHEYVSYYPITNGHLVFGSQSIRLSDVSGKMIETSNLLRWQK